MITSIQFFVPGVPAPQGSKRALGPGRMIESSKNVGPWRERIALAAHNVMTEMGGPLLAGPIAISLEFVLPRPKSAPKSYTPAAVRRPDIDKLARAVLDAITKIVFTDDAQVTELHAVKRLAEIGEIPGANIKIGELPAAGRPEPPARKTRYEIFGALNRPAATGTPPEAPTGGSVDVRGPQSPPLFDPDAYPQPSRAPR